MNLIKNPKIAVERLGHVCLHLALESSRKYPVIGFDLDSIHINEIKDYYGVTKEASKKIVPKSKR